MGNITEASEREAKKPSSFAGIPEGTSGNELWVGAEAISFIHGIGWVIGNLPGFVGPLFVSEF